MKKILLIYPFFLKKHDRSVFRFPPLGIAYVAASLRASGHMVTVLDCTFMKRNEALARAVDCRPDITGIYSMATMRDDSVFFAKHMKGVSRLIAAGGPLPSSEPESFLRDFDVAVIGEGERAMVELASAYEAGKSFSRIPGIAYKDGSRTVYTAARGLEPRLDSIVFPARDLLPNRDYINYGRKKYGYAITSS